jgi:predicted small metal-binding protein
MKRFACGMVIPGCGRVFTGPGDQNVLDRVLEHVAADHGLVNPSLTFIELVMTHTRPFTPISEHQRFLVVGPDDALPDRAIADSTSTVVPNNVRPLHPLGPKRHSLGRAHETYRHECLFYAGTDGFLDAVVPFVRDGLIRREPVMVAVAEPRLGALRSALGPEDAARVAFADMAELGHNPARIIPAWREFTGQHSRSGHPIRGVGEPIWATRQPDEIVEAQLHEALLNMAVPPDVPLWLLCPYDTVALDQQVLAEAYRSHPVIVESDSYRGSTQYGGTVHVDEIFGEALPEPTAPPTTITFSPRRHRHIEHILRSAATWGFPVHRAVKLAAAIDEIAAAGDGDTEQVRIRMWPEPACLSCEVIDPGTVDDPMIGRRATMGATRSRDRAIRLANELCDLVQVRSGSHGTTTRVHCRGSTST